MAHVTLLNIPASAMIPDQDALLVAGDVGASFASHKGKPVLSFDDTAEEAAITPWYVMPGQYAAGTLKATLKAYAAAAGDGSETTDFEVYVAAVTAGDAHDLNSADEFTDSANEVTGGTVIPTDQGYGFDITITLGNKDSVAAADAVRFGIRRDTDDGDDDDSTGDIYIGALEIWEDT